MRGYKKNKKYLKYKLRKGLHIIHINESSYFHSKFQDRSISIDHLKEKETESHHIQYKLIYFQLDKLRIYCHIFHKCCLYLRSFKHMIQHKLFLALKARVLLELWDKYHKRFY